MIWHPLLSRAPLIERCTGLFWLRRPGHAIGVALVVAAFSGAALACNGSSATSDIVSPAETSSGASAIDVGANVGDRAPDFTLTFSNDQTVNLRTLREEGRPVVLYFFTAW